MMTKPGSQIWAFLITHTYNGRVALFVGYTRVLAYSSCKSNVYVFYEL